MSVNFPIHLFSLPNKIYVRFDDSFRTKFFDTVINLAGNKRKLSKVLKVNYSNLDKWSSSFCPLYIIKLICSIFSGSSKDFLKENLLEKHIIELRGKTQPFGIKNPIFSMKLSPTLATFLGHIHGDGGIKKRDLTPIYCNTYPELIQEFLYSLKVFGKVDHKIEKQSDGLVYVRCPTVLGLILVKCLKLIPGKKSKNKNVRIPSFIKSCKNESIITAFIRAMYDDESQVNIKSKSIRIERANKKLVEDIKSSLEKLGLHTGKINEQTHKFSREWYFDIYNRFNFRLFNEKIGFTTLFKKRKLSVMLKNSIREISPYVLLPSITREFLFKQIGDSAQKVRNVLQKLLTKPFPYMTVNQWYYGKRPLPLNILDVLLDFTNRKLLLNETVEISHIANCRYKIRLKPNEFQKFLEDQKIKVTIE